MSLITLDEAQDMVSRYQENRSQILASGYSTDVLPLSITLPKSEIMSLLNQEGADSCRIYFGMQEKDYLIDVVLVAVDENGNDIIPQEDYILVDRGARCPNICPTSSILNA